MKDKLKYIFSKNWFIPALLFVSMFATYASRLAPEISGYAQSDSFVRSSYLSLTMKSPHFYGLTHIMNAAQKVLWFLSPAKAAYIMNSLLGAGVIVVIYLLIKLLEKHIFRPDNEILSLFSRLSSVLLYGFSYRFMINSTIAERYIWVSFLVSLSILLLLRVLTNSDKNTYFLTALLGIGLSQHWIFILIVFISYYLMITRSKLSLGSFARNFLLSILILFSIIFSAFNSKSNNDYAYIYPSDFGQFISYYADEYFLDGFENIYDQNQIGSHFILQIPNTLSESFGYFGVICLLIGVLIVSKKSKNNMPLFVLIISLVILFAPAFSNIDYNVNSFSIYTNIQLISHSLLVFFISIGLYEILLRVKKSFSILYSTKISYFIILLICVSPIFIFLSQNYPVKISNAPKSIASHTLQSLSKDSILFCTNDQNCSSLLSMQQVFNVRKDIVIVPYYYHPGNFLIKSLSSIKYSYDSYPYIWFGILSEEIHDKNTKIYSTGMTNNYWKFLGFEKGFVHYIPYGYYGEISLTTPKNLPDPSFPNIKISNPSRIEDPLMNEYVKSSIQNRVLNAVIYFKTNLSSRGYSEINAASALSQSLSPDDFQSFLTAKSYAEKQGTDEHFLNANTIEPIEIILSDSTRYSDDGFFKTAASLMRGAIMISPMNADIRISAGDLYQEMELPLLAKKEYEISLQIDKGNKDALNKLAEIEI